MKTVKPIEPLQLVTKICQDAKDCPDPMQRKTKYINRLTPVFDTDKATDKGIERVARSVMGPHFELKKESGEDAPTVEAVSSNEESEGSAGCTVSRECDSQAVLSEASNNLPPYSTPLGITSETTPPSSRAK
jgi:tRNA acetyltransferase TAN1